jgi:WD40 repeat protein
MVEKSIDAVCFSGDSKFLYYVKNHEYPEVLVYNLETQSYLQPDEFKAANVTWFAGAREAPRLVTAGLITEVWNTEIWERSLSILDYMVLGGECRKAAVADITPDAKKIAVVGKNIDRVHIYDLEQNVIIQTLDEAPRQASWVRYSPDLSYLAAIDDSGGQLCLWRLETGNRHQ